MNLKLFVYKTGKHLSEIKQIAEKALNEASILGLEYDERFVESIIVELLDMTEQEYNLCIRELNKKFMESGLNSFDEFIESLVKEETMTSTGFSIGSRPENLIGASEPDKQKKKKDEDEKDTV